MSIYEIIMTVLTVIFGFLSLYIKSKSTIIEQANQAIDNAEKEFANYTQAGQEKFEFAVDFLYGHVPAVIKPLLTREKVGEIVQFAFDSIQSFAKKQLDKIVDKEE